MKKVISLALALTLIVCLAVSASAASVNMSVSKAKVNVGDKITVTLTLDQALEGVIGLQYDVHFNNELVKLVSSSNGTANSLMQISEVFPDGHYAISLVDTASKGLKVNAGTIYTLTFETVKAGSAEFKIVAQGVLNEDFSEPSVPASGNTTVTVLGKEEAHTWDNGTVTQPKDCVNDEITTYTCTGCGETRTEVTAKATGHSYGDWVVDKAAACTEAGSKSQTCSACGDKKTEAIPAAGHKPSEDTVVVKEPTCEEEGIMEGKCSVCGETLKNEPIPALGHDYKLTEEKAPTCTEKGYKKYVCTRDASHTKTEEQDALAHKWGVWTEDPENGKHVHTCENCGETESADHNWDSGKVTTPATCSTDGVKAFACKDCKAVKAEIIPATGKHDYTEKYEDNGDGKTHTAYCACGDAMQENHDFSINGEVTVKPTTSKEGKQEMLCVCGAKTVKALPKKDANLDDVPKTGDITGQLVLGGGIIIVMLACAWYLLRRKLAK